MTARTAAPARGSARARNGLGRSVESAALLLGLGVIVGLRWLAVTGGTPGLAVGAGFGAALVALWIAAGVGPRRRAHGDAMGSGVGPRPRVGIAIAAGLAFGLLLVLVAVAGPSIAGVVLPAGVSRPAAPFLPWALVTIVVATAEEGILRGALFDRLRAVGGLPVAIGVTTVAFALMHVPLYGWQVVPLDLAVGLGLAGLRLATRSVTAPAVAHAVADLATWWL